MIKHKNTIIGILIIFSAISISICAASYSIFGLGKLFSGAYNSVIIMASCLEISKIILTAALHIYWDILKTHLKIYLVSATFVLMMITSMGIYGFLSDAYTHTKFKDDIVERKLDIIRLKKSRFDEQISNFQTEKNSLNNDMNKLRENISVGNQTQRVDEKTGQILTNTTSGNKSLIVKEIEEANKRRDFIESQITPLQDSSSKIEIQIIELESNNNTSSELGPLKYIAKISTIPMDSVVNYFLLLIILVFDPLALALIILAIDILKIKKIIPLTIEIPKSEIDNLPKIENDLEFSETDDDVELYPNTEPGELYLEYLTHPILNELTEPGELKSEILEPNSTITNVTTPQDDENTIQEFHATLPPIEKITTDKLEKIPKTKPPRKKPVTIVKDELPPAITHHLARSISKSVIKNTPHQ